MSAKPLLVASVFISILLLGCTGAQQQPAGQQQQPAQNPTAINARTGANVENASAPPAQPKQQTCALTLSPSSINAGSSTEIGFAVQSAQSVVFTYNCGNEIREISTGGLTSGSRLCQFDAPGEVNVWIKADGAICAQKTLVVQEPRIAKTCHIDQSSVKRDLTNYYYEARVQFAGFSPQDVLVWACDRTTARHTLGGGGATGMPLYSDIYCDFPGKPTSSTIDVSIGDVSCGSISTR
jgi:hypothetical protein